MLPEDFKQFVRIQKKEYRPGLIKSYCGSIAYKLYNLGLKVSKLKTTTKEELKKSFIGRILSIFIK